MPKYRTIANTGPPVALRLPPAPDGAGHARRTALFAVVVFFLTIVILLGPSSTDSLALAASQEPDQQDTPEVDDTDGEDSADPTPDLTVWIGGGFYEMEQFNDKLRVEGNDLIEQGLNAGIDIRIIDVPIPQLGIRIKAPIGFEYLEASSKTVHQLGNNSATVNWQLPVVGVYVAPTVYLPTRTHLYIRPIGIGLYQVGGVIDARLSVTDRPGHLAVSGRTIGATSQIGLVFQGGGPIVFFEAGYRKLTFKDISLTPMDGFTVKPGGAIVQPGNLPETLDYSGLTIRAGLGVSF